MGRLGSERIVTSSPLTYTGSYRRIRNRVSDMDSGWVKWLVAVPLAVLAVAAMWAVATVVWVASLALLFVSVPWKLLRRGARKRKLEEARHRERLQHGGQ